MINRIPIALGRREDLGPIHPVGCIRARPGIPVLYIGGGIFVTRPPPVMPPRRTDNPIKITVEKGGFRIRARWTSEVYRTVVRVTTQCTIEENKSEGTGIGGRSGGDVRGSFFTEYGAIIKYGRCRTENKISGSLNITIAVVLLGSGSLRI